MWRLAVLLAVAALFLAACEVEQEVEEPETSPTAQAWAEPSVVAPTQQATASSVTPEVTGGMLGCPDCVKAADQLAVAAEDVQLGLDGKYYVADRGDGCAYRETGRAELLGVEKVFLWADGCEGGWDYEPATGLVIPLIR